ncbi:MULTISPECIES: hypothetical protein [unclassified Variovorax]|uniref:hypothetical protein n=1 Tax=unclassified Variovorax TaxID=663243 RepID=UPI00076CB1DA|nr:MULTISPECIES: hypothetical protein [unclassified Variovorax]KWT98153.1 hypothetical protein APY03_0824 [Variovorax sp. WDL1]PNG50364.1 hypothetical protein CHC06_05987 [Variovorax sp. B2]PNG51237.1 hypothetical protein CHC07_05893 [Variovorax sp. B4]VTV17476.1 hypothetical protein WDL1P1_00415 [Variovorax sp. WDL1]
MSKGIERFERFWRELDLSPKSLYVHPKDEPHLDPTKHPQFQLQVLPIPVLGNLRTAEAVILTLNAGYGDNDEAWRKAWPKEHEAMTAAQSANIQQQHTPGGYPFYDFNPAFRTHPGVAYWKGGAELAVKQRQMAKLRGVATELGQNWKVPLEEVHRVLAHKVAVLEWCPYRSKDFTATPSLKSLPSVQEAMELARNLVLEGEKLVIVTRHIDAWGYQGSADSGENLVVYDKAQGTSASLTMNSAGGRALLKRLLRAGPTL